jgi:cytochrome c oxidase subunit 2
MTQRRSGIIPTLVWGLTAFFAGVHLVAAGQRSLVDQGSKLFIEQGCYGCHTVGKMGSPIGPDLSRVGARHPQSYLLQWLRDPTSLKPTAHMPKIALTEEEVQALAAYLASLR